MNAGCFKCDKAQWDADGCTCEITGLLVGNAERGCEYRKDIELKPCPFCGSKPILTRSDLKLTTSGASIDGDIITYWSVRCNNCGIEKSGYLSEYFFTREETLKIRDNYDGKAQAIEAWNRRTNND